MSSTALLLAVLSAGGPHAPAEGALAGAAAWLWSQQAEDGGWHSETYGLLRSGQALTPFVLQVLLGVPETVAPRPRGAVERALSFIRRSLNAEGALGLSDPDLLEYPVYATAYGLRCLVEAGGQRDRERIARMRSWLAAQQYREETGFDPGSFAYGGWGFGGRHAAGVPGHMDIAHTRRALEALRESGGLDADAARRAQAFLGLVQKLRGPQPAGIGEPAAMVSALSCRVEAPSGFDGGFYFSPVVLDASKGGWSVGPRPYWRSYATATCDGVLALLAAGVARDDERVRAARRWLEEHGSIERPDGIPAGGPIDWAEELGFYHLAVRAEALRALGAGGDWRARIADRLLKLQRPDGSFFHARFLMKEDDPLLATALAAVALAASLR